MNAWRDNDIAKHVEPHKMLPSRCEACRKRMRRNSHIKLIAFMAGYAFALIWMLNQ